MPEVMATQSKITMALLGGSQDLFIYICRSHFEKKHYKKCWQLPRHKKKKKEVILSFIKI